MQSSGVALENRQELARETGGSSQYGAGASLSGADKPRRYTMSQLLSALEKQELSEQEFLTELTDVREDSEGQQRSSDASQAQVSLLQQPKAVSANGE